MKDLSKHLPHYLSLLGIFIIGILGFVLFSYDRVFQMAIIVAVGVGYVFWGIIHHWLHRDLYLAVVFEYLAVAILGIVIVFSLLYRT